MKIHLQLTPSAETLPYDYQRFLVGAFHKWVGINEVHNDLSLYSLSWLVNGQATHKGLNFRYGTKWVIGAADDSLIRKVLQGVMSDPAVCFGMKVEEALLQENPDFGTEHRFLVNSPILLKKQVEGKQRHVSFQEKEADEIMTSVLKSKLEKFGVDSEGVEVFFDRTYPGARQKLVTYRGIGNRANVCPVIVRGTPEQVAFAWNVGIGHSTGIGFGALN